ncbi:hypothetical protein AC1031_015279 [Aphanomyces cochlioides]|nr:hypothetical protein AC1031_015279 [Aphanomyces cochlioides]
MPSWKVSAWSHVADNGLKQSVVLSRLRRQLHVALNFVLPSGGPAGQCVVSLADPAIRHGRRVDFIATLSIGGRRTGELSGKAIFSASLVLQAESPRRAALLAMTWHPHETFLTHITQLLHQTWQVTIHEYRKCSHYENLHNFITCIYLY